MCRRLDVLFLLHLPKNYEGEEEVFWQASFEAKLGAAAAGPAVLVHN